MAELGLDIERALPGDDAEVAVRVDEGAFLHTCVARVDVRCETLAESGIA